MNLRFTPRRGLTSRRHRASFASLAALVAILASPLFAAEKETATRRLVPREHPRLLGPRARLEALAQERADAYRRVADIARKQEADDHAKVMSLALVAAIERDRDLGLQAVDRAMKLVRGPVKQGHVPFAHDLALCGIAFDLCNESWKPDEREAFIAYLNTTVDANVDSETHVFHNGWYGYKQWGIGIACYASYHENARAPAILRALEEEFRTRAAPALELAGAGGGWAEGYYINYWLYEWLFFCEVARLVEGVDYYAMAPSFFRNRAWASMFEAYPGIGEYGSRRPIPMGDGGGRLFGGDRDKALSARRILVNAFRDDPDHQIVQAFNETTPRSSVGVYAYKDFLWRDSSVRGLVESPFELEVPLSHLSPGPGYVYARSSWDEDATYFFFKCGDRFTAHQHLDNGHFLIYKFEELAGDGGHYDDFGSMHDVNYHLRTIAHSTILVLDPNERWPGIRAGSVTGNDGGQAHDWPHHNGAVVDAAAWQKDRKLYDIADITAFKDADGYLYVAGDVTRSYSPRKLSRLTRQILFLRPGTFVIFDRVVSRDAAFKKTWLLQAMKVPERQGKFLVVTNGKGRLFVQTLLPENASIALAAGSDLSTYGGGSFPPRRSTGPAPECRVEISPPAPREADEFLHVLTATDAATAAVPEATATVRTDTVVLTIGKAPSTVAVIAFTRNRTGGSIEFCGLKAELAPGIRAE